MAFYAISLALPVLAAYALVAYCDREARRGVATFFLRVCLAIGVAVGLSSAIYFLWLFFVGVPAETYHIVELAFFATAGLLVWLLSRMRHEKYTALPLGEESGAGAAGPEPRYIRLLSLVLVAAVALAVIGAVGFYQVAPAGDWDAWAIWNLRARTIFRAGEQWHQAFKPVFAHPDYPLLVPSGNARAWSYLGAECPWAPWFLGSLLTFATVGLLSAGVCRLRGRSLGLLAGIVLLGIVPFVRRGVMQYADVPLAFFILAAVLLLVLHDASKRKDRGFLVLSGLMASLAAWTKNEGLLFCVVLLAVRGIVVWRQAGARRALVELLWWGAGAWPALAIVGLQKVFLVGNNDLVGGQGLEATVSRLIDPIRYCRVTASLVVNALHVAGPFAVVLPLCFWWLGVTRKRLADAQGLLMAQTVLMLMLAGYFFVYITTPVPLQWHLNTSADRLLLQLLPLCLLILFHWLAAPEQRWARETSA